MKLDHVEIENYRAIKSLRLPLHPDLNVLHGDNGHGKTSVLTAIATGLGSILDFLPGLDPDPDSDTAVSGVDFLESDCRGSQLPRVVLKAVDDGPAWERRKDGPLHWKDDDLQALRDNIYAIVNAANTQGATPLNLPIVAFYDTDRAVDPPKRRSKAFNRERFARYQALQGALSFGRYEFRDFFAWFYAKENDELREERERREHGDFGYRCNDLEAVRRAITSMIPEVSNPRIKEHPLRFVVSARLDDGSPQELSIDQLSGGYRIMLALAADLARRMAQGNPHLDNPLESEAVVLIDEVELHLHPAWQQRVLADLTKTFPNTQFIVSTHSPQVLTTVKPEHILELSREEGEIVAGSAAATTYGAQAGHVLAMVMGVDERPGPDRNEFVDNLMKYRSLVADGRGESPEAVCLRETLDELSPRDPALDQADIEIRHQKLFQRMAKSR